MTPLLIVSIREERVIAWVDEKFGREERVKSRIWRDLRLEVCPPLKMICLPFQLTKTCLDRMSLDWTKKLSRREEEEPPLKLFCLLPLFSAMKLRRTCLCQKELTWIQLLHPLKLFSWSKRYVILSLRRENEWKRIENWFELYLFRKVVLEIRWKSQAPHPIEIEDHQFQLHLDI